MMHNRIILARMHDKTMTTTRVQPCMCAEWAQLIGGVGTAAAGSTPRSAGQQGMLLPEGTDLIDARVIFAAAEKGDIRALAQTSLKLVEGANKTIGALAQQVPAKEPTIYIPTYLHGMLHLPCGGRRNRAFGMCF
eukprot:COSAG01_NODE_677_length_14312_cov_10.195314_14_plen_135_part_00